MKYDQLEMFEVKVSGTFHVLDNSKQEAIEFIENDIGNLINDLSIGNWYEIELEDIQNAVSDIKDDFKDKKVDQALDMLVRHFKELIEEY
tara:strand:- start:619 stop:888 length:270 start_codon:yes stop_codon:yes gene_type:complete